MTAKIQNLFIDQGTDYDLPFLLLDDSGYPENLVGATAVMQVRASYDCPAVLTLTTEDGSLVIDGIAGSITPHVDADATAALLPGLYVYDIKMLESNGRVTRPRQGTVTVIPAVTTIDPPPAPSPAPSPAPAPSPSPDVYGNSSGDTYGNSDGDQYGPA